MIPRITGGTVGKAESSGQVLVVGGAELRVTHETVPIGSVRLDPDNPRIRFQLQRSGKTKPTTEDLQKFIKDQPGYDGLQKAIRKAGGLHDPVVIRHDGTVVEGNSRVTVVATLHKAMPSSRSWKTLPVVRLPKSVPEAAIAMLMASYHVAGKNKWLAFAKADQIYQLVHKYGCTPEQIADETRNMSKRDVDQSLEAYRYLIEEVMPSAGKESGQQFLESKWSHALEFVKNREMADMRKDPAVRKTLAKLIVKNQIKGAEVRELPKIFKNKTALKVLKNGGFKEAKEVLKKADPTIESTELRQIKKLTARIKAMRASDWGIFKTDMAAQRILEDHAKAIENLMQLVGVRSVFRRA
jgi:hypothetical protein